MDRLDVEEILIDEAEAAVSVPVRTKGSGDHTTPVVLVSPPSVFRRAAGNSAKAGFYDGDGDGTHDGILLKHIYAGQVTIEFRSNDEVESYELAKAVYDRLAVHEEYPASFHGDMNDLFRSEIESTGFQGPTPEPIYKHTFSIDVDYSDTVQVPFNEDTGEPIENIDDTIST